MNKSSNTSLTVNPEWSRIVSMLVLSIAYAVAQSVLIALVIGQVLFRFFGKRQNEPLQRAGQQVSDYMYQILIFLTFNSEYRPFPYHAFGESRGSPVVVPGQEPTQQR